MTDEKKPTGMLETPPLCMMDYFAGQGEMPPVKPATARVVARCGNVIEIEIIEIKIVEAEFVPVPKTKARRLTSRWEEAGVLLLLAACAAAGVLSLVRH